MSGLTVLAIAASVLGLLQVREPFIVAIGLDWLFPWLKVIIAAPAASSCRHAL